MNLASTYSPIPLPV